MLPSSSSEQENIVPFSKLRSGTESFKNEDPGYAEPIEDYVQSDATEALPDEVKGYIDQIVRQYPMDREGNMGEDYNDKYIEQRFKNVDDKIDHKVEMVAIKIDALSDKISDNTDWMKKLVDKTADDVKRIEDDGKRTRTTIIITGISVVIGLAALVIAFLQLQTSWTHKLIDEVWDNNTQISTPVKPIKTQGKPPTSP